MVKLTNIAKNCNEVHVSSGSLLADTVQLLFSYDTLVAMYYQGRWFVTEKSHSKTTNKHIGMWVPKDVKPIKLSQEILEDMYIGVNDRDE